MRRLVLICLLAAAVTAGCGGGSVPTITEVNSGAPPYASNLKGLVEQHVRNENKVSSVSCRPTPQREPAGLQEHVPWTCDLRTKPMGDRAEIEILVGVSTGSYSIFECRTNPGQEYTQRPRGVCKSIR
jgi:hypothetical protein